MPLLSEALRGREEAERRRLYSLFTRATKQGQVPALKLLTRFEITGSKGQMRQVSDYAYPQVNSEQVAQWITQHTSHPQQKGVTSEQAQAMSDDDLMIAIKVAQTKRPPSKPRKPKTPKKPS